VYWNTLVVGAGLSGTVAARQFAENGHKVLVVEKKDHLGGHCNDYINDCGICVHRYGPHIFHTASKEVWDYVNRFSPFSCYQHRVKSYVEGRLMPFPINLDTVNEVFGTHLNVTEVKDFLKNEVDKAEYTNPPWNFRDTVVSQVGERLYNLFFANYTKKQWNRDPEELSPDLAKRIPVRTGRDDRYFSDQYQGIPARGYTEMIREILNHPNISLLLNTDYFEISNDFDCEFMVYTGELDRYFDYRFGKLEYRSLRLEMVDMDSERYQSTAVVNYPNDYEWTRITEFKHFLENKSDKTTLCFEFPETDGNPYYIVPTRENFTRREKYMKEVAILEKSRKVFFLGRLAEYKYFNMDEVILNVLNRLRNEAIGTYNREL
jgi:UDP-galactopyranose mutase